MKCFNQICRWSWAFLVAVTLVIGLGGCEGDDGAAGAPGANGAAGAAGADGTDGLDCWDLNDNGVGDPDEDLNNDGLFDANDCGVNLAKVTPLESCGVCHDDGSFASATAAHEVFDLGSFGDFAVAPDGADLVVSFSATADGAAATAATFRRAYVSEGGTVRTSLTDEIEAEPTLFTNNGDGTYSLRIVDGVARFGATNSRYLVVVLTGANDLEIAAVGDYPDAIPLAGLASSEACVGCHGASGEGTGEDGRFNPLNRGGHYSAPMSADACVVCHRPDNPATPDVDEEPSYMQLVRVVHGIHNSHEFPDGEFVTDRDNTYNVSYPTYMTNCSVCHSDDAILPATGDSALAAANAMPVSGAGCFTCHGSLASWDFEAAGLGFHLDIPDPETADCTLCHKAAVDGGIARANVAEFHNGARTGRGGIIWDGVDTSVDEGANFEWQINGVVDDGTNLAISWQASYKGAGVDPCNATVGIGAPVFFVGNTIRVYRNYAQGDDFILGQSTSSPGQALNVTLSSDNTNCDAGGGVAVTTIPVDTVDAEKGRLALGGKPLVVSELIDPPATVAARVPTPTYDWLLGDGTAAAMRRDIVDTGQCLQCHVGSLYQHGGDRVDNVDMCILCHNSASNEKDVRVGMGVDASEAYDGKVGETFEMKTMLHRIHSAGIEGQPVYAVYRNRGIYAFAPDVSDVPNWDVVSTEGCTDVEIADGKRRVFGSDDASPDKCEVHNFHSADYPRALNACTACHTEDFDVIPDQTEAMATTTDAGSDTWENQLDDTLQGAATTACITCHADGASKGHAYQNSWTPQVFPDGRQTIIDAVN
jgi:OmcA/MtrC family decaheme c-type cytochrome